MQTHLQGLVLFFDFFKQELELRVSFFNIYINIAIIYSYHTSDRISDAIFRVGLIAFSALSTSQIPS